MLPEQMRAARAALNWSLDRLAEKSGVHRNTLSNFETRKFEGDPAKVAAAKRALRAAGILFIEEGTEAAGVRQRRYRVGDRVSFRRPTTVGGRHFAPSDIGTVVQVEGHPPAIGPTYRIAVEFADSLPLSLIFQFEFELVAASPNISLREFVENSGYSVIPNGHFIINPAGDTEIGMETDLSKLPTEVGAWIVIPTADTDLLNEVEARGFWRQEASQTLYLLWRQFPAGASPTSFNRL
ncbi:helix-turn-helix domain-containing protein [Neorhizobium sp. T7_12]|uniref:helix-turn-helix domain-containing protein n=1 Tax=Neorhizobium sp. T7_12 TaxID=2093832 RepID=UPI00155EEE82|nr:helix-turn-helix transcriptional regulator [Neorhizobium sp. T7_12]